MEILKSNVINEFYEASNDKSKYYDIMATFMFPVFITDRKHKPLNLIEN